MIEMPPPPAATQAVIRVLIADDHLIVRSGLERLLGGWPSVSVVGSATDGRQAVDLAVRHRPDVVLMDLSMPVLSGIEATRLIAGAVPDCQVVVLTSFGDPETIAQALDAGAVGYLLKDGDPDSLRSGIEMAASGGSPLHPHVARAILSARQRSQPGATLTERETEILELLRNGLSNKEIAARLGITVKTVKAHLSSLFRKIDVLDRTQAALWAERRESRHLTGSAP